MIPSYLDTLWHLFWFLVIISNT